MLQLKGKMMISKIKLAWDKFLDWEDKEAEFDNGWVLLILLLTAHAVFF